MSFCKSFGSKVKSLLKKIDAKLEELGPVVIKVTTGVRNLLNGPLGDVITAIIPGDIDNMLRDKLIKHLGTAIDYLAIIDTCKDKKGTEKVNCFIEELKKKSPAVRESLLVKLASILVGLLHDGQLKRNEYDLFMQIQYSLEKAGK